MTVAPHGGMCAEGFDLVREAFVAGLDGSIQKGCAVAVHLDGRLVVNLWGGLADPTTGTPWVDDTLMVILSATKGITAACVLMLWEDGTLDIDAPVASLWPEFTAAGKGAITTRQILSHSSGLPAFDHAIDVRDCHDQDLVAARLAAQAPRWPPGAAHGYHALTFGWLLGEIVRRTAGRTIGQIVAELRWSRQLDLHLGLVPELEPRVACLLAPDLRQLPAGWPDEATKVFLEAVLDPTSLTFAVFSRPVGMLDVDAFNTPEFHQAEWPAASAIATAGSLAALYGLLATGEVLSTRTLAEAIRTHSDGPDLVLMNRTTFGLGFSLASPMEGNDAIGTTFGHEGAGGVVAFGDRDNGLGFAYLTTAPTLSFGGDPCAKAVVEALYTSISARR